ELVRHVALVIFVKFLLTESAIHYFFSSFAHFGQAKPSNSFSGTSSNSRMSRTLSLPQQSHFALIVFILNISFRFIYIPMKSAEALILSLRLCNEPLMQTQRYKLILHSLLLQAQYPSFRESYRKLHTIVSLPLLSIPFSLV